MPTLLDPETIAQRRALVIPTVDLELPAIGATLRYEGKRRMGADVPEGHVWHCRPRKLAVLASLDFHKRHGLVLLHVSLSHPHQLPSWAEVAAVRDAFFPPDLDVMMVLPRRDDYVNVHPFAFHLQQLPVVWGAR